MKYIPADYHIPYFNFALEEYLLTNEKFQKDEYLFFYVNHPSVIIGRHQNAYAEVNLAYTQKHGVYVARRLSGGGAVYHDGGNLNFSFILNKKPTELIDFKKYTLPVVNALKQMGLNVTLSGRNDILLNEKKISGNAEYALKNRLLHHGTIMFDVNIEQMLNCLNVSELKISSKAIKSVKSRVINIKEYLGGDTDIVSLKNSLVSAFTGSSPENIYNLTEQDKAEIERLGTEKYSLTEYNLGQKQTFDLSRTAKFPAGIVEVGVKIKNGRIETLEVTGDFFADKDITEVTKAINGVAYNKNDVSAALSVLKFDTYIVNFTLPEFIGLLFGE